MDPACDLVVIGSGPAGEKGAAQAAYFGRRVTLVERSAHLGGAGINTGTVPSKTLRETALYFSGLRQRGLYGIDYSLKDGLTVADFMHRERVVVDQQRALIARNLERHRVEVVRGTATVEHEWTPLPSLGDFDTRVRLDPDDVITEPDETNNSATSVGVAQVDVRDLEAALVRLALRHGRDLAACPGGAACRALATCPP